MWNLFAVKSHFAVLLTRNCCGSVPIHPRQRRQERLMLSRLAVGIDASVISESAL